MGESCDASNESWTNGSIGVAGQGMTEAQGRAHVAGWQAEEDVKHGLLEAKRTRARKSAAEAHVPCEGEPAARGSIGTSPRSTPARAAPVSGQRDRRAVGLPHAARQLRHVARARERAGQAHPPSTRPRLEQHHRPLHQGRRAVRRRRDRRPPSPRCQQACWPSHRPNPLRQNAEALGFPGLS